MSSSPDLRVFFLMIPPRGQYLFSYSLLFFFLLGQQLSYSILYLPKVHELEIKEVRKSRGISFLFIHFSLCPAEATGVVSRYKRRFFIYRENWKKIDLCTKKKFFQGIHYGIATLRIHTILLKCSGKGEVYVCVCVCGGGGVSFALYVRSKALQCNASTGSRCRIHCIKPCWPQNKEYTERSTSHSA